MHTINNYVTKEYIGKAESIISKWQKTSLAHTCTQTYTNEKKERKEGEGVSERGSGGGTQSDIEKTSILK